MEEDEQEWINVGVRDDVGWLHASTLSDNTEEFDGFVHHICDSSANVLIINAISNDGLEILRSMPRLRALVLYNCSVNDEGLDHLKDFPHLETVGFCFCDVTDAGVTRIQREMHHTVFELCAHQNGFVFKDSGCLTTNFRRAYGRSTWR